MAFNRENLKICSNCGASLNDDAIVCPRCGCETELGRAYRINNSGSLTVQVCGVYLFIHRGDKDCISL